jgi:hypothetical protein
MRRAELLLGILLIGCGHHGHGSDGGVDQGVDAAVKIGIANGMLGTWSSSYASPTALPPLPTPRANHCSVARGGRLYVMGGNYLPSGAQDFVTLGDIQVADQNADGSLSAWRSAGTLPGPVNGCTATTDGTNLYAVGGIYDDQSKDGQVWSAAFQADGSVSSFTSLGMLPAGHDIVSSHAFVRSGTLFVFDSTIGVQVDAGTDDGGDVVGGGIVLLHATLGATLGTWTQDQGPTGFRGRPQYADTAQNVYALGGYLSDDANTVVTDGFGAAFSAQTGMGASFPASDLPQPRAFGVGAGVDDWVFVVGGKNSIFTGAGQPDVYAAQVGAGGVLGAFSVVASMPSGRTNMDAVVLDNYLYVTGGGSTGGGLDNVFAAQVRY